MSRVFFLAGVLLLYIEKSFEFLWSSDILYYIFYLSEEKNFKSTKRSNNRPTNEVAWRNNENALLIELETLSISVGLALLAWCEKIELRKWPIYNLLAVSMKFSVDFTDSRWTLFWEKLQLRAFGFPNKLSRTKTRNIINWSTMEHLNC